MRPPFPKELQTLNHDYELWTADNSKLQYVVLRGEGEKKIAAYYKNKYGIEIFIAEHNSLSQQIEQESLYNNIKDIAATLKDGQAKGLVFTSKVPSGNYTSAHAQPYIIAKKNDKIIVVDFRMRRFNSLALWMNHNSKADEFMLVTVDNYDAKVEFGLHTTLQKDRLLCGTFALNVLKQSLRSAELLQEIFNFNPKISLTKLKLGQTDDNIVKLSEEEREKYVREIEGKSENLDAWYRAHCYARQLNPRHMELLDEKTKEKIEDIDRARKKYKEKSFLKAKSSQKLENELDEQKHSFT